MEKHLLMFLLFICALGVNSSAKAHITPGIYVGKTPAGESCQITAIRQYFENGFPHPLNERIVLNAYGTEFIVGHPPVVEAAKDLAFFNHDLFQGVQATKTGALALVIEMVHQGANEGPRAFHVIENMWKSGERKAVHCLGLRFQATLLRR